MIYSGRGLQCCFLRTGLFYKHVLLDESPRLKIGKQDMDQWPVAPVSSNFTRKFEPIVRDRVNFSIIDLLLDLIFEKRRGPLARRAPVDFVQGGLPSEKASKDLSGCDVRCGELARCQLLH